MTPDQTQHRDRAQSYRDTLFDRLRLDRQRHGGGRIEFRNGAHHERSHRGNIIAKP